MSSDLENYRTCAKKIEEMLASSHTRSDRELMEVEGNKLVSDLPNPLPALISLNPNRFAVRTHEANQIAPPT